MHNATIAQGETPDPSISDEAEPDSAQLMEPVRIVAIGASAGGLEPLEEFFDQTPADTGLAYVVVQHLSPDFKSMMSELLTRHSPLEIRHISDGMAVEANKIYLNPARKLLTLSNGCLYLSNAEARELNLPINFFFRSLAEQLGIDAIGVVLSGTGTDGAQGALAIQQAGRTVFVQEPASARFDSMPRAVIEEAPSTAYGRPSEIPSLIQRVIAGEKIEQLQIEEFKSLGEPISTVIHLLQERYLADFNYYKQSTVGRRIARRVQLKGIGDLSEYAAMLQNDPDELEALYRDLLIGVTSFFRDREAFDSLSVNVVPSLLDRMRGGQEVRVWVAGCASGEEAYSLAILLSEAAREADVPLALKIFATDLHPKSLENAGKGIYSSDSLRGLQRDIQERYFLPTGDEFQIRQDIRQLVVFTKHNLIKDPPFTRLDLVSCRNLLIYLNDEAQRKSIAVFHFALRQRATLLLGPSETTGSLSDEFEVIDQRWRVFKKRRDTRLLEAARLLPRSVRSDQVASSDRQPTLTFGSTGKYSTASIRLEWSTLMRVYDAVLANYVGTSVLVSHAGELLHVFGDAERYLSVRSGGFSARLVDLIDDHLRAAVSAGLDRMRSNQLSEFKKVVRIPQDGTTQQQSVQVTIQSVNVDNAFEFAPAIVMFSEVQEQADTISLSDGDGDQTDNQSFLLDRIRDLEQELHYSEETLQNTIEELETSNEELQATNEELMAANEELHSVNEEVHAVNEELYTVSTEHQLKIDELLELTNDMDNLLQSTDIGVVFLDRDLNIRRITPAIAETFNILPRDIGRPISHVTLRFEFENLEQALRSVMENGIPVERGVQVDNTDFLLRIRPYQRQNSEITGAVLTAVDVSDLARANRELVQFADIVSHHLKTPLRAIRNAAQWIVEDLSDQPDETVRDHIGKLTQYTDRLGSMLSDLRHREHP